MLDEFGYALIGSVSHGTMRSEDLAETVIELLEEIQLDRNAGLDKPENFEQRDRVANTISELIDALNAEDMQMLDEAMYVGSDVLEEFAPPYCYFGAHPGDGSDFGYWPDEDFLRDPSSFEVTRLADLPSDGEAAEHIGHVVDPGEYLYVNDHGNATFGYVDQDGQWHEVWSVV